MDCPKCGAQGLTSDECPSCGVLVSKFVAAQERKRIEDEARQAKEEAERQEQARRYREKYVEPELVKATPSPSKTKTTRTCPYCYSEMDHRASVCPTCRKSSISLYGMKIIGIIIAVVCALIVLAVSEMVLILALVVWGVTLFGTLYAILGKRSSKTKKLYGYTFACLTALLVMVTGVQRASEPSKGSSQASQVKPKPNTKPVQSDTAASTEPEFKVSTKEAVDIYWVALKNAGVAPGLVVSVGSGAIEGQVKIKVDNAWHYQPKQVRLQAAQNLWKLWVIAQNPTDADHARISIVDFNGNEVGGSRVWGGSLVWVAD